MAFPKRLTETARRGRVPLPARERDVFDLVPLTDDIRHLEHTWRLDEQSSPVTRLLMWHPTHEEDKHVREYLLSFAQQVILAERRRAQHTSPTHRRTTR